MSIRREFKFPWVCVSWGGKKKENQEGIEVIQVKDHLFIHLINILNTRYVKITVIGVRDTVGDKKHGPWYQGAYILVEEKDHE